MNNLLIETEVDYDYNNFNCINSDTDIITEKGRIFKGTGRHYVNRNEYMKLFSLLSNEKSTIMERSNKLINIPLYFDIDLKDKEKKKLYDEEKVIQIIQSINDVLPRFYDIKQENLKCALLEKPIYKSGDYYKNGFHLHYPCIFVNKEFFINKVFPIITDEVKKNVCIDLDKIYSNGWLMYNCSKKQNLEPYLVTKFYDYNCKEMTVFEALKDYHIYDNMDERIEITNENFKTKLPNVFSLNLWNRTEYLCDAKNTELLEYQQSQIKKKLQQEERQKKFKEDNRDLSEKADDLKKYLPLITDNKDYNIWFRVARAIYDILEGSEEGLDLFIEWSSDAGNFDENACERLYNGLTLTNNNIGKIKKLAKEYSPEEYAKLHSEEYAKLSRKQKIIFVDNDITLIDKLYNESNGLGHHDFATIYKEANRDDIIFTTGYGYIIFDETTKLWSFNNTKNKLIYPLCQFFTKIMKKYQDHKITEFDDEKDLKIKAKKFKILTDIISNCGNTTFINGVIAQLEGILTKPNSFVDIFDSKPHLFAFSDGYCIDMSKNGEKRKIEKEDYIMTTCGYAYPEKNEEIIKDANDILWSLTENEEQDKSLKSLMSLGFYGKNINELFIQMTGSGGNGKGLCATIMNNVYGSYYKEISPDQLTEYDKDKGRANSELADCRFARIVMTTEPKDGRDATLKTPMLKRWTGNDKIQARYLHKDAFEYTPKFTLMMQLNDQMDLSTCDDAIKRRLRVLGLEFSFVDDVGQQLQPFEKFKDTTLKNKISQREFTDAFCHIMIDTYLREKGKFYESVKVKAKTSEFFDTQNPVKQWFLENYVVCDEYEGIRFFGREMYNKFRDDYPNKHLTETAFGRLLKQICKTKRTEKGVVYYCKRQSLVNQQNTLSTDLL